MVGSINKVDGNMIGNERGIVMLNSDEVVKLVQHGLAIADRISGKNPNYENDNSFFEDYMISGCMAEFAVFKYLGSDEFYDWGVGMQQKRLPDLDPMGYNAGVKGIWDEHHLPIVLDKDEGQVIVWRKQMGDVPYHLEVLGFVPAEEMRLERYWKNPRKWQMTSLDGLIECESPDHLFMLLEEYA